MLTITPPMQLKYGCFESFPFRQILLFSSARSRDLDGTPGTELLVSMYTKKKTPIDMCHFNVRSQLNFFLTFSVEDRYQLNYFI